RRGDCAVGLGRSRGGRRRVRAAERDRRRLAGRRRRGGRAVGFNSNLAGGWTEPFPLAQELSRLLGRPVRVANDVEVAADAELELGAGRELRSFLAAWWGTGLGGSVVLERVRWRGNGAAGELGHMVV